MLIPWNGGLVSGGSVKDDVIAGCSDPSAYGQRTAGCPALPQQRLILAVLALQAGQVVPVGELVDAVWDQEPPRSAQASIQVLVTRLRRDLAALPGAGVERRGDGYRIRITPGEVDAGRFRSLVRAARQEGDSRAALTAFDQALGLWRGPALADVPATAKVEAIRAGLTAERLSAIAGPRRRDAASRSRRGSG